MHFSRNLIITDSEYLMHSSSSNCKRNKHRIPAGKLDTIENGMRVTYCSQQCLQINSSDPLNGEHHLPTSSGNPPRSLISLEFMIVLHQYGLRYEQYAERLLITNITCND